MHTLEIKNLHVSVSGKKILAGINLKINSGEIHAIMGPNGSGKSTLLNAIMGHPKYKIEKGDILFDSKSILELETNKRAALGIFMSFQNPREVPGVIMGNFLRTAKNLRSKSEGQKSLSPKEFLPKLKESLSSMDFDNSFIGRSLNDGFSGGEKKRAEIVQMKILNPKIALFDEIDSGLDIDALKTVAENINNQCQKENMGALLITHYKRILDHINPDKIHILYEGKIIKSGSKELAAELEKEGYQIKIAK